MKSYGMRAAGLAALMGIALSGCSGLSGLFDDDDDDYIEPIPSGDLSEHAAWAQGVLSAGTLSHSQSAQAALQGVVDANAAPLADTSGLRNTGTYAGGFATQITQRVDGEDSWVTGELQINANFDQARVTGVTARNVDMHIFDGNDYEGTVRLGGELSGSGGAISDGRFNSDIRGTLTNPDHDVRVTGQLDGEFRGQNGQLVAGGIEVRAEGAGYAYTYRGAYSGTDAAR